MKDQAPSALGGRRVLEIADGKGEYCGKLLADLGADVIKIEPPGGQCTRALAPFYKDTPSRDGSLSFLYPNANKRSLVLDLTTPDGVVAFERLAASADIIVYADGVNHGLLDFERLRQANPRLVLTCISDFGLNGPWSHYLGSDLTAHALGGSAVCIGEPDDPPVALPASQAYVMASTYAAAASLAALVHVQASGQGQLIDLSVVETVVSLSHVSGAGKFLEDGIVPKRFGTFKPNFFFKFHDTGTLSRTHLATIATRSAITHAVGFQQHHFCS